MQLLKLNLNHRQNSDVYFRKCLQISICQRIFDFIDRFRASKVHIVRSFIALSSNLAGRVPSIQI